MILSYETKSINKYDIYEYMFNWLKLSLKKICPDYVCGNLFYSGTDGGICHKLTNCEDMGQQLLWLYVAPMLMLNYVSRLQSV